MPRRFVSHECIPNGAGILKARELKAGFVSRTLAEMKRRRLDGTFGESRSDKYDGVPILEERV